MVVMAFKNGTYSKISEFYRFFTRVDDSLHKAFVNLELTRHDLMFPEALPHHHELKRSHHDSLTRELTTLAADALPSSEDYCKKLWDNRDALVMIHYNSPTAPTVFQELQTDLRKNVRFFFVLFYVLLFYFLFFLFVALKSSAF